MRQVLPKPEHIPFNRVAAVDLALALQREYSKARWREAQAEALARWLSEGNKITKVASVSRSKYVYRED